MHARFVGPTSDQALEYLLTLDTSQQKGLIFVGPKRSGKGTIARVLRGLLGAHNCAGPTLGQLGRQFGLQGLIGKSAAIISDARLGGASDIQAISENLLRITGEDFVSVDRKGIPDWGGKLSTRFILMTNILPGIVDGGGAIGSRFIVLNFQRSFFGHEDLGLTDKLLSELPGILNWALEGLAALQAQGRFLQPSSGQSAVDDLIRKTTPLVGFMKDVLVRGENLWVAKDDLYSAYLTWCRDEGLKFMLSKANFFAELYAISDGEIRHYEPRSSGDTGGKRVKAVRGASLATTATDQTADPFRDYGDGMVLTQGVISGATGAGEVAFRDA